VVGRVCIMPPSASNTQRIQTEDFCTSCHITLQDYCLLYTVYFFKLGNWITLYHFSPFLECCSVSSFLPFPVRPVAPLKCLASNYFFLILLSNSLNSVLKKRPSFRNKKRLSVIMKLVIQLQLQRTNNSLKMIQNAHFQFSRSVRHNQI